MVQTNLPFEELPFNDIDFDDGAWAWGAGGTGFRLTSEQYFISHTDVGGNETIYILPPCLNEMLIVKEKSSRKHLIGQIHRLLEIGG